MLKLIKDLIDGIKEVFWRYLQEKGKTGGAKVADEILWKGKECIFTEL